MKPLRLHAAEWLDAARASSLAEMNERTLLKTPAQAVCLQPMPYHKLVEVKNDVDALCLLSPKLYCLAPISPPAHEDTLTASQYSAQGGVYVLLRTERTGDHTWSSRLLQCV